MVKFEKESDNIYNRLETEVEDYRQFVKTSAENRVVPDKWNEMNSEILYLRNRWKIVKDLETFLKISFPALISNHIKLSKSTINAKIREGLASKDETNITNMEDVYIKEYDLNYNMTTPLGIVREDVDGKSYVFFATSSLENYVKPIFNDFFPGRLIDTGKGYYVFNLKGLPIEEIINRGRLALAYVESLMEDIRKNVEEGYGITIEQLERFRGDPVRFDGPSGKIIHTGMEPDWDRYWSVQFNPEIEMNKYFVFNDDESDQVLTRK